MRFTNVVLVLIAAFIATTALAGVSFAGTAVTPEIDASSISAGLGVLTAAVLIVRARRGK